jgi:hypothetical protein
VKLIEQGTYCAGDALGNQITMCSVWIKCLDKWGKQVCPGLLLLGVVVSVLLFLVLSKYEVRLDLWDRVT